MFHQQVLEKAVASYVQIGMHHLPKRHPFSAAEDFMEIVRLASQDSPVFTAASDSCCTITRRTEELADYVLRAELLPSIHQSSYFCLMLDDSFDKATHEQ